MKPAPFPTGISGSGILIVFRAEFLLRKQMSLPNVAKLTYVSESKLYWNERKFQKRIVCSCRALRPGRLKTSLWNPRCQTYVFESKIAQGIQVWVQNNQLPALSSTIFKNCFGCKKIMKKIGRCVDFLFFLSI